MTEKANSLSKQMNLYAEYKLKDNNKSDKVTHEDSVALDSGYYHTESLCGSYQYEQN